MEEKKKLSKFKIFERLMLFLGTPLAVLKGGATLETKITESSTDGTKENTVGYENIGIDYNVKVHSNNFVMLHVSTSDFNDITALRERLEKCDELGISVGLILDTKALNLADIYKDIDYLQAIIKEYKIDLPIYCNIDTVMEEPSLNNYQKKAIIDAFLDKGSRSDMYLGVYGKDSNLVDCDTYVFPLHDYDCFVVQDGYQIKYDGTCNLREDMDGVITASYDLSEVILKKNLNSAQHLVFSSTYKIEEGDTYHSLSLRFGLSEHDLINYNGGKRELVVGEEIFIPNLFKTLDTVNNKVTYSYAVARGIDISDYQTNLDWNRIAETSDYVIVEVARDVYDSGRFIDECVSQIDNVLANDISLGLYFCISERMDYEEYEERLENYFTKLDTELSKLDITFNRSNVPVFLDFEVYNSGNDYYKLMKVFEKVCNEHDFTRIGIYGNGNTLGKISDSLVCDGKEIDIKDTNWYVWKSGGPQYSGRENTNIDDVKLDELIELECSSSDEYMTVMQQVTNVCTDTGASNGMGHCDVSFLYDYSVFGDSLSDDVFDDIDETYAGTVEINLDKYPNLPVQTVARYADLLLSGVYVVVVAKVVGQKLFLGVKRKIQEKKLTKKM